MTQQWLSLVLDVSTAILAIMVVEIAISLRRGSSFTGIALVNLVSFNSSLRSIIVSWSLAETSIGAVSRVKQLEDDVKPEALAGETVVPTEAWPQRGSIDIMGITAAYEYVTKMLENLDLADWMNSLDTGHDFLTDVDLTIRAGEKIGICGRTGRYAKPCLLFGIDLSISSRSLSCIAKIH